MTPLTELAPAELRAGICKALVERFAWFKARYDVVNFFVFRPTSGRVYLVDKATKVRRYCGRDASQGTA